MRDRVKKIFFYTRSGRVSPSSNFRAIQYVDNIEDASFYPLSSEYLYKKHGNITGGVKKVLWYGLYYAEIQLRIFIYLFLNLCSMPHSIVIQRALSPKMVIAINRILMKAVYSKCPNLIWDFDDDIISNGEITGFEYNLLVRYAKAIVVSNSTLVRDEFRNKRIELLNTTDLSFSKINLVESLRIREKNYQDEIHLLWLATANSLPNLEMIVDDLDDAAEKLQQKKKKRLVLNVVCNKKLETETKYLSIQNIQWSAEIAQEMVVKSHIGIMPLMDTPFSRGKGGFKIIQYMAAGMPSIVSAVGINTEIVVNGETGFAIDGDTYNWGEQILELSNDWDSYQQYCLNSRKEWNEHYSYNGNLTVWKKLLL